MTDESRPPEPWAGTANGREPNGSFARGTSWRLATRRPSGSLRAAMLASGKNAYTIGKLAGVDTSVIQKFMSGKRGLSLENVDRVAAALDLRLCWRESKTNR
jgi:hypothetical protein